MTKIILKSIVATILLLALICTFSCNQSTSDNGEDVTTNQSTAATTAGSINEETSTTTNSGQSTEKPDVHSVASTRYALINGQWQSFSRLDYNANGQLLSVTALDPYTLSPMYYETIKTDRIYTYSEDGKLDRVWMSYNYFFELEYSENGNTASGIAAKGNETVKLTVTFNDKGGIKKEEYTSEDAEALTVTFEYDNDGRLVNESRSNGFDVAHTYENELTKIKISMNSKEMAAYDVALDKDGRVLSIADSASKKEVFTYTYAEKLLPTAVTSSAGTVEISYNANGKISSLKAESETSLTTENFEYDENGNIKKYTRNKKYTGSYFSNSSDIFEFVYNADGCVVKINCEHLELDANDNVTSKRTDVVE